MSATMLGKNSVSCATAILLVLIVSVTAEFNLTILHTNDIHARIEQADKYSGACSAEEAAEKKCYGGVARIRTMVKTKRHEYPNRVLLVDAGDQFQGTLWFYQFGGIVSARFMNLIGYDAMAIGNHEFDKGIEGLRPFAHNLSFPLLSSNADVSKTPDLKDVVDKSTVITKDGEKIGIVGYTTTETAYISQPETVTFSGELEAIQKEVDKLTNQGVNKIIAVGHAGFPVDVELAKKLKNVDVIVGGHTNTFLYKGVKPSNEDPVGTYPTVVTSSDGTQKVLVVQDYAYGKYLGELHVTFDDAGIVTSWSGNPILLDHTIPQDNETLKIMEKYIPEITQLKTKVVGQTHVDLMANRIECRTTECNLGNVITDAMVRQNLRGADSVAWSDVGIAVVNAGSFRASIQAGPIKIEDVIYVQPFRNTVDIIEITGRTLMDMFEFSAEQWTLNPDLAFGGFLQVSGLQVIYDIKRPVGKRVVDLKAVCTQCKVPKLEPVKEEQVYKVLASSFLAGGGDGYSMLPDAIIKTHILGNLDTDILLEYIKTQSPITQGLEGRIRHLETIDYSYICANGGISSRPSNPTVLAAFLALLIILLY